jgi:hypothetical protein
VSIASDLETARAAKDSLVETLSAHPAVNGVGIQPVDGGYALVVNLLDESDDLHVPSEVEGVDVHVAVTGAGFPQDDQAG